MKYLFMYIKYILHEYEKGFGAEDALVHAG